MARETQRARKSEEKACWTGHQAVLSHEETIHDLHFYGFSKRSFLARARLR